MTTTLDTATDKQLIALRQVFNRTLLKWDDPNKGIEPGQGERAMTFAEFLALVEPGPGCLMVPWLGMWLGIEPDGYTHS